MLPTTSSHPRSSCGRFSERLYSPLGADLWIVKLRAKLPRLIADAHSYAGVRPDCMQARPWNARLTSLSYYVGCVVYTIAT